MTIKIDEPNITNNRASEWVRVRFDALAENIVEHVEVPSESGYDHFVGGDHLDSGSLKISRWGSTSDVEAQKLLFKKGHILFGKRNAYLRKVAYADFDGVCSAHMLVLKAKPEYVLEEFLPFFMQTNQFWERAIMISEGSMSPTIKWKTLAQQEFVIPPKDEQRRIADILWAADEEKNSLILALESLQKLICAVGTEVFSNESNEPMLLGKLVAEGFLKFQTGPFGTVLKASSHVSEGIPIVNPTNMVDGKLITFNGPFVSYEESERLSRYRMQEGDIILGRKGEMGRVVYVTDEYEGYIVGSDCIRLRLNTDILQKKFLYYLLISPQVRSWLSNQAFGTTMPGVNEKTLAKIEVSIPSPSVQSEIVKTFQSLYDSLSIIQMKLEGCKILTKVLINHLLSDNFTDISIA